MIKARYPLSNKKNNHQIFSLKIRKKFLPRIKRIKKANKDQILIKSFHLKIRSKSIFIQRCIKKKNKRVKNKNKSSNRFKQVC